MQGVLTALGCMPSPALPSWFSRSASNNGPLSSKDSGGKDRYEYKHSDAEQNVAENSSSQFLSKPFKSDRAREYSVTPAADLKVGP